ncbi:MAG: type II toxin-antitoxin system RelE/ParE family toxin [Chloroflexi bacterium]|nr:type II toxin-antitoxin system RelE/ParE family toxin [Chloroflexota bacterium]
MYEIELLEAAEEQLAQLDRPTGRRFVKRLNWLAANFSDIRPEPLTGDLAGLYKFRVGDYRIVYEVIDTERLIIVHAIGHRREIYRKR